MNQSNLYVKHQYKYLSLTFLISFILHLLLFFNPHQPLFTGVPLTQSLSIRIHPVHQKNKANTKPQSAKEKTFLKAPSQILSTTASAHQLIEQASKSVREKRNHSHFLLIKQVEHDINRFLHKINVRSYYPRSAIKRDMEGTVLLSLTFRKSGELRQIKLEESSSYPLLDSAAIQMMKEYKGKLEHLLKKNGHFQQGFTIKTLTVKAPIWFRLDA